MRTTISFIGLVLAAAMGLSAAGSGRPPAMSGVSRSEGDGGLTPWAPVTGYGARDADMRDTSASLAPMQRDTVTQ